MEATTWCPPPDRACCYDEHKGCEDPSWCENPDKHDWDKPQEEKRWHENCCTVTAWDDCERHEHGHMPVMKCPDREFCCKVTHDNFCDESPMGEVQVCHEHGMNPYHRGDMYGKPLRNECCYKPEGCKAPTPE